MNKKQMLELLPEYVNDTLDKDMRDLIDEAIKTDGAIRLELKFLNSVRESIKNEKIISPTEWGLARLKQSLNNNETEEHEFVVKKNILVLPKHFNSLWKNVALAASVAFVLQSGYLLQSKLVIDEGYRTLSSAEFKDIIKVRFKDNTSELQIRRLLINLDGNIVDGPSVIGIYNIQFINNDLALSALEKIDFIEYAEQ
jgi:hypothetical protein